MFSAKQEFDKHRKLFIQNVPPVTHQDVKEYLGDINAADIVISKRLYHVIITLKCSDEVDFALQALPGRLLAGHQVEIELYPRRMMLYICGIPLHYDDNMYRTFLSSYGKIETAFLSLTTKGHSRGYGFVEFAHNRATLEQVQHTLHGSTQEGNILYCGLVSDSLLTYDQTFSQTLYSICDSSSPFADHPLLQHAQVFALPERRQLYVVECSSVEAAESLWYHFRTLSQSVDSSDATNTLKYAMPMLSPQEIVKIVCDIKRKYPTLDNISEVRHLLHKMFANDQQSLQSLESYLYTGGQMSLRDVELTPNFLTNLLQNFNAKQAPFIAPPLTTLSAQHQQPVSHPDNLISEECSRRKRSQYETNHNRPVLTTPQINTSSATTNISSCDQSDTFNNNNTISAHYSGPFTRQRKRSLEDSKPVVFRKTPGSKCVKRERPVLFEADLNIALPQLFSGKRKKITITPKVLRKLLPEPEDSPGSPRLIGQHSQGIGGHYVDSYKPSTKFARL